MDVRLISRGLERPRRIEFDPAQATETYGLFVARPLERGFGHTLGNALRRVLLSSITGAAITSIKIEGVEHEFSTIDGVVEDVTEIVLNLKGVRLRIDGAGPRTLHLRKKGQGAVKAGEIERPADTAVLNPDHHVATIDGEKASLAIEIEARRGRGYVPAEENKQEGVIGLIPVDSLFSPVSKVAYRVENTRVGQKTDYDRLTMEIWTDGSIRPEDALAHAAKILTDHFRVFIHFEDETVETDSESSAEEERLRRLLGKPVEELELSVRSANCLRSAGIKTLGELVVKSDAEILKFRNFGKKSLQEIKEKLGEHGLALGMRVG
jgi:DNA-directed RNA polymerase subunit alpha